MHCMQHIDYRWLDQRKSCNFFARCYRNMRGALFFVIFLIKSVRRQEKNARRATSQITYQGKHWLLSEYVIKQVFDIIHASRFWIGRTEKVQQEVTDLANDDAASVDVRLVHRVDGVHRIVHAPHLDHPVSAHAHPSSMPRTSITLYPFQPHAPRAGTIT